MAGEFMPDGAAVAAIRAELAAYERERAGVQAAVRWRIPAYVGLVAVVVAGLAWLMNPLADPREQWVSTPHVFLYLGGLVGAGLAYFAATGPAKRFGRSTRQRVLPMVFGFIRDVTYRNGIVPGSFRRLPEETVEPFGKAEFDDVVTGTYEDFAFELYEARLDAKGGGDAFRGVIVAFEKIEPFPGVLLAVRRAPREQGFLGGLFRTRLQDVASGDAALDEAYAFRTDNVAAARPLVTGPLARALAWLAEAWPGEPARVALSGRDGFLLIPSDRDFFRLPADGTAIDYAEHVAPMIADIGALLATAALVRKAGAASAEA